MKRKTVNSILKGVAGVGLTLGGVSALSDANLVFANEFEQPEQGTSTEKAVDQTQGDNSLNVGETSSNESDKSDSVETAKSDYEIARQEYLNSQPDATCTMSTVADAMIKAAEEANKTNEDDAPASEEGSESESASEGEDTTQTSEESNTDQDQEESSEESPELKDLREKMEAQLELVNGIVDGQKTDNDGNGSINGTRYYREADELVKLMIEYYTAVEGFDGTIEFSNGYCSNKWVSNGIDHDYNFKQNYLATTYKDALGEVLDIIYYDYVNADKNGEILTDTKNENKADMIDHIVVYEKTPVFITENLDESFTFERDEFRNITAYIIDGQKIEVKVDENGDRYIVDTENEDGSVVTTTVTGNNDIGYTVKKTVKKADESEEPATIEKVYKKLVSFTDKGTTYKKDLPKESEKETETSGGTGVIVIPGVNTPAPQPEIPADEIEDEDVPLADVPDVADEDIDTDDDLEEDLDEDATDLEDEDVPLAVLDLDEPVDIPDADVPLSDNPETGDALTATWIGTAAASVAGLFGASRKKRKG